MHQAIFAEDRAQCFDLAGIAPVQGRESGQGGMGHEMTWSQRSANDTPRRIIPALSTLASRHFPEYPMSEYRTERDSMGELKVPADALYGAQTQRAVNNFPISGLTMPRQFIRALGLIKSAAAQANSDLGHLKKAQAKAIRRAAERVAAGEFDKQFPIDVFQTGSGTSSNMNANEVIAHVASTRLGAGESVHPNDQVNASQSSNDVFPSAVHLAAALAVADELVPAAE